MSPSSQDSIQSFASLHWNNLIYRLPDLLEATYQTVYMSVFAALIATILGSIPAIILILTAPNGLSPKPSLYHFLDGLINILRSFPFVILIIVLFPFTKFVVGTTIGTTAAIVPLAIGAAPFITRVIENALKEVDKGVIEAAKSFGASNFAIIFRVMLKEALPNIVSGLVLMLILIIGFSAMAGTMGGGGLGDVAIRFGLHRYQTDVMVYTCIILVLLVQIIQTLGNFLYKKLKK